MKRTIPLFRALLALLVIGVVVIIQGCGGSQLKSWHTQQLDEEFTAQKAVDVQTFADYLALEDRLFRQLDDKVYALSETRPAFKLDRFSSNSAADPRGHRPNWKPIHPKVEEILSETHGLMVYQEDVTRTAMAVAGLTATAI